MRNFFKRVGVAGTSPPLPEKSGAVPELPPVFANLGGVYFRCRIDAAWTFLHVGENCLALTGFSAAELLNSVEHSLEYLTHPEDRASVRGTIMAALASGDAYRTEYRIVDRAGCEKWVLERGVALRDEQGERFLEGYLEDITDWVQAQHQLAETELRYRSIFEHSVVGMFQSSEDGHYLAANPALAKLYGYADAESLIAGLHDIAGSLYVNPKRREEFKRLIQRDGKVRDFESEVVCRDGKRIWISENAHVVRRADGSFLCYEGTVEDITERRRHQSELHHQATHDLLTGLPNRQLLADRLDQAIRQARRNHGHVALAFVDLDNFKVINDSLGHAMGDLLLVEVAARLRHALRAVDTVARYGGDEFVLIMGEIGGSQDVSLLLDRVVESVQAPVQLAGHTLQINCSIGVSLFPEDARDLDSLLRVADVAMYQAKESGKGRYCFYTRELSQAAQERFVLENALHGAIERRELTVVYQPKVDASGRVKGCEALVRWVHPEHGMITPDRFIPLAEETGQIIAIGEFVLFAACHAAAHWPQVDGRALSVAVNLSARQLREPGLADLVSRALARSKLPASCLELEITESMIMGDVGHTIETLAAIRQLGVRIAVDDFGTGYSSLAYLQRLPIDTLKIDRSFVSGCDRGGRSMAIPHAIIFLGKSLDLHLVAEGVENEGELQMLVTCGCNEYQGYYFSRPLPEIDLLAFFERQQNPVGPWR